MVTGIHPQRLQPLEPRIAPGYVNIGSAYGAPIMQPAGGSRSTTSRTSLRLTDPEELRQESLSRPPSEGVYEQQNPVSRSSSPSLFLDPGDRQDPLLSQHPESFQTPPQQAGLYGQQTPVDRISLPSIFSDPGDGQGPLLSQHPESFQTPPQQAGLYGQQTPISRRSLPYLFSNPGYRQDPFLSQHTESFQTPPQQAGLYWQQTPVNREVFASNNAQFLVPTSSSRGSASSRPKPPRVGGGRSLEDSEERQWQEGG